VLFADLKGSMELLADRDPEEARTVLDPVLERMMEAVHRYEGTVNQVMGDGIMALFGAPVAHEDHGVRACYAALRMQEAVGRYAEDLRRTRGLDVQIRVGLNSGEVVVRSIGSDLHMDYTAVGQTTHLAARLEQLARPGTALLTADTVKLAEGHVQVRPLGRIPIKGLADPIEVLELVGGGLPRRRFEATAARGLTRFVGRQTELAVLAQALDRARAGHGQIVAPVGDAGVGKSRLFWEFTHSHHARDCRTLESGSVSYGKATPYLPVIDLLKAYFEIDARDDGRKTREKVTGKLLTLDRALEPLLPPLLALLDVPVPDGPWQALDPPQRRQQTLDAVKRLLLRESQVHVLVVVVEDLHWIDSETQAVLDGLVESLPTARILLLVNYRPEYEHRWGSKTFYTQLRLAPLPAESAEALLDALLGDDPDLLPLKQLLVERTEGNPFFLEESVRTLLETRLLVGERGGYRLVKPLEGIQVPATVQAVLAARIDRLPPEEKQLLQASSVVGKDVPFALLRAVTELPEAELRRQLTRLQHGEFLYEATFFPELEYTFKHALTHDVAYGSLLQDRRRALHARIVEAIEQLHGDALGEHVALLAHHALQGQLWDQAATYLWQAAAKAAARATYRQAVVWLEQALGALAQLPQERPTVERAIDIRFDLRSALLPLGETHRILDQLREAENLATHLDDRRRLGWVSAYMTIYFLIRGPDHDRALAAGERAVQIATALGNRELEVVAGGYLAEAHLEVGEYRAAIARFRRSMELLSGLPVHERFRQAALPAVNVRAWLADALAAVGAFPEATVVGAEGLRIAEDVNLAFSRVLASISLGRTHLWRGDLPRAIAVLEPGLQLVRTAGLRIWFPHTAATLGAAYALSGRPDEGVALLTEAVEGADAFGSMMLHALHVAWLGEASLLAGRPEEALRAGEQALGLARDRRERGHEAWALRLLGEIASERGPAGAEPAETSYRQALALATELDMRPLVAHCHLGLGGLARRAGDRARAEEHLTTAAMMYREMDMEGWLARAEARVGASG
jgi:class 3 adenylate cyclase/tetratricopeptide (TPR) repeat protein